MKNALKAMFGAAVVLMLLFVAGCSSDDSGSDTGAVTASTVTSISAVAKSSSWTEGDTVSVDDITVTATYSDNSTKTVSTGYTLSGDTTLKAGANTITVTYGEKTTTVTITAKAKASGGEEEKTGTVTIEVTVDGKYKCSVCGTEYDTKAEAENCAHEAGCPGWEYTVTFNDAEGGSNATVIKKVKNGSTLAESDIPTWAKDGFELSWSSSEANVTTASKITKDVTFTAVWTGLFTVKFVDSDGNEGTVTKTVKNGDVVPASDVPAWTKDHYTLSWNGDTTAAITADTTFTSVWTENAKFTVRFVDSAIDEIAAETDSALDTQSIYSGEKASLPAWASASRKNKSAYTVTWTSSVEGLTPSSAITADVTFTASWSKTPKYSYITFSGTKEASATSSNASYTVTLTSANVKSGGTVKYAGITYNTMKMESKTVVTISGAAGKKITVVADSAAKFLVNDTQTTAATADTDTTNGNGYLYTFTAPEGDSFTLKKSDVTNIGVIIIEN